MMVPSSSDHFDPIQLSLSVCQTQKMSFSCFLRLFQAQQSSWGKRER